MKRISLACIIALVAAGAAFAQPTAAFADKPALVTAIGQSADFEMIKVLLTRSKIPFTANTLVMASDLNASSKTLILVAGGSSKGLGAAGISAEVELERTKALLKRAKELKMKIITVHVGGVARRGPLSDSFIEICMAASDYAIIVADGDSDGLFTKLAGEAKIALTKVPKISTVGAPLAAAFK
ncbi:MAG: hypothetical protein KKA67_14115 [Spirochaetes bacterium]|nr:hypothetical protein [Spirochaetota bacterium]MBU1081603.1 hypothetical protein [Spirochaetota bacterium]